ncbi:LysE family translocator [Paenibacillus shunpengii]|uniref:LysE family translocator n=1 Tax=Paenibacillus shunpengii TaxID=2054424 RepID=A0ABW5SJ27_9BACL|nr:LysE family translocator [Paenibacillus sp. PDC88]SDX36174.1 Threonine/homoserine/homoserine lactone efflux protein [Paenibacillus sp. PDC88]
MLGIINFEVFLISSILLNITPGPDTMYVLGRSVAQGKRAGIVSALGITAGGVVHTLLAAFGLSVILMSSAVLFNVIKVIGAIYLAYLGIRMLIDKASPKAKSHGGPADMPSELSNSKIFTQGLFTNVTNPKVAMFFLAFMPQFIAPGSDASPLPFVVLGLTYCLTGGIWSILIAAFSSTATGKLRNNVKMKTILNKATGFIFIAMSITLLRTKAVE